LCSALCIEKGKRGGEKEEEESGGLVVENDFRLIIKKKENVEERGVLQVGRPHKRGEKKGKKKALWKYAQASRFLSA